MDRFMAELRALLAKYGAEIWAESDCGCRSTLSIDIEDGRHELRHEWIDYIERADD